MARRAKALISKAQSRLNSEDDADFLQKNSRAMGPDHVDGDFHRAGTHPNDPPISSEAVKALFEKGTKVFRKIYTKLLLQNFDEVVSLATEFLSKSRHDIEVHDISDVGVFNMRALAYFCLDKHDSVVNDTTSALNLITAFLKMSVMDASDHCDQHILKTFQCRILLLRAKSTDFLGDMEGALVDVRAAIALEFELGSNVTEDRLQERALILLARIKAGSPRPHFTSEEIRAWNKEFKIKEYSKLNQCCLNCGISPSSVIKLKLCGNCKLAWFCGTKCQRMYWPTHKPQCTSLLKKVTALPIETEADTRADIKAKGFSVVHDDRNGPAIVVCDGRTGAIHESLSDQDVAFLADTDSPSALETNFVRWSKEHYPSSVTSIR